MSEEKDPHGPLREQQRQEGQFFSFIASDLLQSIGMCGHPDIKLSAASRLPLALTLRLHTDRDWSVRNGAVQSVIEVVVMVCLPGQATKCLFDDIAGLKEEYKTDHLSRKRLLREIDYWLEPRIESSSGHVGGTYV